MAIIQISRIQVRRGRELQGTGVPKLASGEFGWAVDTQKLYIGPGTEQEGSPDSAENVRILTASDNVLSLGEQYYFRSLFDIDSTIMQTAPGAVGRSLQSRLDDFVNARSFGLGSTNVDDTDALEAAISSLFDVSNSDQSSRTVLYIPSGEYTITRTLQIPPYANIVGEGIDNTVLIGDGVPVFETIGDEPFPNIDYSTQSRHVNISNMTLENNANQSVFIFNSCRNSNFRNIKIKGSWRIAGITVNDSNYAMEFVNLSNLVTCRENVFDNFYIENFAIGIYAPGQIVSNKFSNFIFYDLRQGVEFGDETPPFDGPLNNIIESSKFDLIFQEAIKVINGNYNVSKSNTYLNVGKNGGDKPEFAIIDFKTSTNISVDDFFERTQQLTDERQGAEFQGEVYVPEILGKSRYENRYSIETDIGFRINPIDFIKLPAYADGTIFVDYIYTAEDPAITREGELSITVNKSTGEIVFNEEYSSTGDPFTVNQLEFAASLVPDAVDGFDTIIITATNTINNLQNDSFHYTIKSKK